MYQKSAVPVKGETHKKLGYCGNDVYKGHMSFKPRHHISRDHIHVSLGNALLHLKLCVPQREYGLFTM